MDKAPVLRYSLLWFALFASSMLYFATADMPEFIAYQHQYHKTYSSAEYMTRYNNFENNLKALAQFQKQKTDKDEADYGITEFFDLSDEEFNSRYILPPGSLDPLLQQMQTDTQHNNNGNNNDNHGNNNNANNTTQETNSLTVPI